MLYESSASMVLILLLGLVECQLTVNSTALLLASSHVTGMARQARLARRARLARLAVARTDTLGRLARLAAGSGLIQQT